MRATTLLSTTSQSEVCSQSYGASKSWESQPARFQDFHSGVPGEKSHLDVGSVANHRVYYKGEGGGFPQVRAVVNLVCPCCLWVILAPKVFQLCTNHFVLVVRKPLWVSEACQLFLIPSQSSNMPFYPSKCCELRSVSWFLPLPLSFTWTHIWVRQVCVSFISHKYGGASTKYVILSIEFLNGPPLLVENFGIILTRHYKVSRNIITILLSPLNI
jgi:hypothetical protein